MTPFDPAAYSPAIAELLREPRLMPLGPGTPDKEALKLLMEKGVRPQRKSSHLPDTILNELFAPHAVRDRDMADSCRAGLWLYFDHLDESHSLSQDIHTPTGSYWHGLLHRREPDFGNPQ